MKVKIILNTLENVGEGPQFVRTSQEVWKGEMEIPDGVMLAKLSVLGEGEWHPIVDIPFSLTEGYWRWTPGDTVIMDGLVEKLTGNAFDDKGRKIET